jgi:hypothetical protein
MHFRGIHVGETTGRPEKNKRGWLYFIADPAGLDSRQFVEKNKTILFFLRWLSLGIVLSLFLGAVLLARPLSAREDGKEGCTVIGVGKNATVDGSVITSHTDCCSECRIQVIPGRAYPKGTMASVHWGMVYFGGDDNRKALPIGDFGKVIGRIPQVEKTFTYFHTGYSQMNERQLAIGESTCSQRAELNVPFVEGITRQIMTIEQAQVFALERCATAREAVRLIAGLVEKYGHGDLQRRH